MESPSVYAAPKSPVYYTAQTELPPPVDTTIGTSTGTTEEVKFDASQTKAGVNQAAVGLQDSYESAQAAGQDDLRSAKGKTKAAASQGLEAAKNLAAAGSDTLESLAKSAEAARSGADDVGEGAKKTGHGIANMAKTGANRAAKAGSALKTPLNWTYNKATGALSNAAIPQPTERMSMWWGPALMTAGIGGLALASAASWGATLFVTLPALAAGTAALGALFVAQKLARRLWNGAPTLAAGADNGGISPIGRTVHNACVTANTTLEATEKDLLARKAAEEKKIKAIHSKLNADRAQLGQSETTLTEINTGLGIVRARKLEPVAPIVVEEAQLLASEDIDIVRQATVTVVKSGTVQGEGSVATPAVHVAEATQNQSSQAFAPQAETVVAETPVFEVPVVEATTSTARVDDYRLGQALA